MAQLQPTDKFIVDRGGSTYKTTFQDIEESLDIDVSHEYNAEVLSTEGGEIETFTITEGGKGFLVGQKFTASTDAYSIEFTVSTVDSDGGLTEIDITSNDPFGTDLPSFTVSPISQDGSLLSVTPNADPSIPDGGSVTYNVRQTLQFEEVDDDGNGTGTFYDVINTSGEVLISNNGGTFTYEVVKRGVGYDANEDVFLELTDVDGNTSDGTLVTITVVDIADVPQAGVLESAVIDILSVTDGVDSDKAKLTVTVGGLEKNIYLIPGNGIRFNNFEKSDDGEDQIEIVNTLTEFGQGGGTISEGSTVIVSEDPPTVEVYNIKDGTLWYNLSDGRLYVAVTYYASGSAKFDWIDASPSSLNDSLRKNQDDSTYYNLRVERNESLNPGDGGSFYAYHFNLEELPLIS